MLQHQTALTQTTRAETFLTAAPDAAKLSLLTQDEATEAIDFLSVRPVQAVVMASFIADNGIVSELNRGRFYGHRDVNGDLDGVALIGHTTLFDARSDEALKAFAFAARNTETPIHLIMSSGTEAERFYAFMTSKSAKPRLTCVEDVFEAAFPFAVQQSDYKIEKADLGQLEQVAQAQADLAFAECGADPMVKDRDGFMGRVARRIAKGRIFTVCFDGKLVFKADIIAQTNETIYLEGIYVHPDHRGQGLGSRCLASLTQHLLAQADHLCLLSNVNFPEAQRAYEKSGYRRTDQCVTLFV